MSKMNEFVAFRALIELIKDNNLEDKLEEVYNQCLLAIENNDARNHVNQLYDLFTVEEISTKIGEIVKPDILKSDLDIVYQTVENLHLAIPNHTGDWYFTGNFPTAGGNRVVNKAFVNYMEGKLVRAY
jgi:amidophosphoribosyltransferase